MPSAARAVHNSSLARPSVSAMRFRARHCTCSPISSIRRLASMTVPLSSEQQRGQPHRRERVVGALGALQAQPCRHEGAARQMGAQLVQRRDPLLFDRPAAMLALDAEDDMISGRHLQAGACRPAEPARAKEIAIDRFAFELVRGPEIMLDEKPRHRLSEQADPARTARKPSVLDIGPEDVLQIGRGGPFQHPVAGREQQAAARVGQFGQIIQHTGPEIGDKGTFVDAVDQICLHEKPAPETAIICGTASGSAPLRLIPPSCNYSSAGPSRSSRFTGSHPHWRTYPFAVKRLGAI